MPKKLKTCITVFSFLFFVSLTASSQSKESVEFVGGVTWTDFGTWPSNQYSSGYTFGVGVCTFVNHSTEIIGNTLFTFFPARSDIRTASLSSLSDVLTAHEKLDAWSCEIAVGPRFHGQGSDFIHPFLQFQGGVHVMRMETPGVSWSARPAGSSISDNPGTNDVQLRAVANIGGGLQLTPAHSVVVNVQAAIKILAGKGSSVEAFVPTTLSVQFLM